MQSLIRLIELDEADGEDFFFPVEVRKLADVEGWRPVLEAAFNILADRQMARYWSGAIHVVFFADAKPDTLPLPVEECIARLYHCLAVDQVLQEAEMDNEVWSTVHHWLGLPYTSAWNPHDDPVIWACMQSMERDGQGAVRTD